MPESVLQHTLRSLDVLCVRWFHLVQPNAEL